MAARLSRTLSSFDHPSVFLLVRSHLFLPPLLDFLPACSLRIKVRKIKYWFRLRAATPWRQYRLHSTSGRFFDLPEVCHRSWNKIHLAEPWELETSLGIFLDGEMLFCAVKARRFSCCVYSIIHVACIMQHTHRADIYSKNEGVYCESVLRILVKKIVWQKNNFGPSRLCFIKFY